MQTQSAPIVSKLLTDVSNGFFNENYMAESILPTYEVAQTQGKIGKYTNNHLRIVTTVHAGKGPYRQLEAITVSSDTYDIEDHGLFDIITENDMRNFEAPFDAEVDATLALREAIMIGKEYGLASTLHNSSIITQGTTLSGNSQYNNISHADANPIEDKLAADAAIRDAVGGKANSLICSEEVFSYLARNEKLLDAMGYTKYPPAGLSMEQMKALLQLDNIFVSDAMYNSANEGQADSLSQIWGNHLVYARIYPPARRQKTLGFTFRKSGTVEAQTYRFTPTMPVNSKGVIITDNYDQNILNANCAYLIQNAIA